MYRYDEFDTSFVHERVDQFRDQVVRRLEGKITEAEFRPLRLMNGLYLQLHAYMLRVAIPYGTLSSRQLHGLADIAKKYDKGYAHFTTRQNVQYNWPMLKDVPDILDDLADVEMHAIQTSGNCIRNVTSDQWAGVAADEITDPRPICELIRQWSSLHPEFCYLPRKFKIAVTGSPHDRAAVKVHDIGLRMHASEQGEPGYEVLVGGGLGRTPMIGITMRDWLAQDELLAYLEAILRVYNRAGRRDNKFKARIKILVHETGHDEFRALVEEEYARIETPATLPDPRELKRIETYFATPDYDDLPDLDAGFNEAFTTNRAFGDWVNVNIAQHKVTGYAIANISLKPEGGIPGDATDVQMHGLADLAEQYSKSEIRVTHEQNLVLPYVRKCDLFVLWQELGKLGLAAANVGLLGDIIACPGLDYCALATARSIPIAQELSRRFADITRQRDIGNLRLKISGCINACGHHHVGHIGILGVDRKGEEIYQITLGGSADENATIGKIIGPGFPEAKIYDAIETVVDTYMELRQKDEPFIDAYRRVGNAPFKEALYGSA